jgi:parallel beta-helix repeat protein
MKKIILLAGIILSLNTSIIISQTSVSAGAVSGTWTLAGSPYLIQGSIQIANATTLTIQPGVQVIFQGTYKLNVQGRLLAIGTSSDTIIFTAANTTNGWRGIRFDNTPGTNDSSKIIYCKLQYGKATGSSPDDCGGALYFNNYSKTLISQSNILYCKSNSNGGGIYCKNSNPVITNNFISNNSTDANGGGAIYCDNAANPTISNNIISYNTAKGVGFSKSGGITCLGSPTISNNTITNNTTEMFGGGIDCEGSSNSIITNNIISGNTANYGGGIYCSTNYNGLISDNTISYNTAGTWGGGIYCGSNNNLKFSGNIISNNSANEGGGFFAYAANPAFTGTIFCNNTASVNGGGICCEYSSNPTFINSTITNNIAANGGGLFCNQASNPGFRNCILYGNTAGTGGPQVLLFDDGSDPAFYYCDVQGGSAAFELNGNFYTGTYQNNINADPKFASPSGGSGTGFNGTTADWSLQDTSTCIDKGDPAFSPYPSTDIGGSPRVNVCRIDIGAYEYQVGLPFAVSLNISQGISCFGETTGELSTVVSGGTLPYTYLWNNGQTTDNISGLSAGNYSVTVSETSFGCTLTKSIALSQPPATSINAGKDTTITCGSSDQLSTSPKWIALNNSTATGLNSIFFIKANTGYAVGGPPGVILKTIDAGQSWTQLGKTGVNFRSVYFLNLDTGYVVGGGGEIHKTIDGGTTWATQIINIGVTLYSVFFVNSQTGFITGDNGIILRTTDGGLTWIQQTSGTTNTLYSVYFAGADTGYAVGASGIILKTVNGGVNWTSQNAGTNIVALRSVYFIDANNGYASGEEGTTFRGIILKTTDGGTHWTNQVYPIMDQIISLFFIDGNTGYASGAFTGYGKILETDNGGNSWKLIMSSANSPLNSIYFTDSNTGYAAGWNNPIYKLIKPVSYSWSPIDGLNNTNISNPSANPIVTTNYIVTSSSESGCIAKDTVTVFVNPIIANAGSDKTIICGSTAQLNVTSNYNETDTLIYNWSPATGLNYDTVPNPIADVTSSKTYFVSITTPNGCIANDSVKIIVNPLTVNSGSDKSIICGGNVKFDNPITNYAGSGTLSFSWLPADGLDNATIARPTAEIISDTTYKLSVTTPNGCTASDSVIVTVNPLNVFVSGLSISCGSSAQLNATTNYTGSGSLTFSWSPDSGLNAANIANPLVTLKTAANYSVDVTTPNGCIATGNANVSASVISFNPSICMVTVNDSDKNVVVWQRDNDTAIDAYYIYRESSNQTDLYDLIGTVPDSATGVFVDSFSNARVQSNKYKIAVRDICGFLTNKSPEHKTMHLTINKGIGNNWNLIWEQYIGVAVSSYRIYRGTTKSDITMIGTSSGSNTTYTDETAPAGDVYYQIEVVLPQACTNLKSTGYSSTRSNIISTADATTSVHISSNTDLYFYPNPANDKLYVKNARLTNTNIIIYDLEGKLILNSQIDLKPLDISKLTKGIYIVKLIDSGNVQINKLVKE